jgi:hypothetical protein
MKRIILVFVATTLIVLSAHSQVRVECQGGANFSNFTNPGNLISGAEWTTRVGIMAAVLIDLPLADKFFITSGFRFLQKGTTSDWTSLATGEVHATITSAYMELPVYIKYDALDFGGKLFIEGGPAFGYLLSSRTEATIQLYSPISSDSKETYKSYDFSLDVGLGLQAPISERLGVVITGLYSNGLVNINRSDSSERTRDVRVMLGCAYTFN